MPGRRQQWPAPHSDDSARRPPGLKGCGHGVLPPHQGRGRPTQPDRARGARLQGVAAGLRRGPRRVRGHQRLHQGCPPRAPEPLHEAGAVEAHVFRRLQEPPGLLRGCRRCHGPGQLEVERPHLGQGHARDPGAREWLPDTDGEKEPAGHQSSTSSGPRHLDPRLQRLRRQRARRRLRRGRRTGSAAGAAPLHDGPLGRAHGRRGPGVAGLPEGTSRPPRAPGLPGQR
mmetsp:Transcript_65998/g.185764  ORF Transcript_65998/g.185764 Transcript_65998/m.185764 type:complete len:228 (+) Transcript_65998:1181-1864(+)